MPKFFVKTEQVYKNKIQIIGEDVNHIKNVLRMKKDDELQICNQETGENYQAKIEVCEKEKIECSIIEKIEKTVESNVKITLFQGLPKFDKMELIIQKNTEVGINKIVPVIMERTVVKLNEKDSSKKVERWRKISEIAAKQSMRDIIPEVTNIINVKNIKPELENYDLVLVAYENEEKTTLKEELKKLEVGKKYNIAIIIGPEGGISEKEVEEFKKQNLKFVTLGKRILRTETAGLVMAGNILYELEEE